MHMQPGANKHLLQSFDINSAALMVVDQVHAMLAYWDKDLICRFANAAYLEWFGVTRNEMVDKINLAALLGPTVFELNRPFIEGVLNGQPQTFERELVVNGKVRTTLANYLPHVVNGSVLGFFVHVADISPSKLLEKERVRVSVLEARNKDLEHIAHVASHDLQEPLRTVLSFTELLKARNLSGLDPVIQKSIEGIKSSVGRLSSLVTDLADFSRLGQLGTAETTDLNVLLSEVCSDIDTLIKGSGTVINAGKLPVFATYPVAVRQVFQNLLCNAIKFARPGVAPVINITCTDAGNCWQFAVADNGIGIAADKYDDVFLIFKRLNHRHQYDGNGLGLAICKRNIELVGGKIWIAPAPGQGSIFNFTLPKTPGV